MKYYIIRDMESGNKIDFCDTFEEAEKQVKQFEEDDTENGCYTPDFYEIVEAIRNQKTETTIPTEYVESLRNKIYKTLMNIETFDEGELIEKGIGDMQECREEAERIVQEWMDENNLVEIEPEPILN